MFKKKLYRPTIEALESRIAPAALAAALPTIKDAELAWDKNPFGDTHFVTAVTNTPLLLHAGQVLTTGSGARAGQYLMFVQKGTAEIFSSDLNNNGQVDYNEITGIAAGDGLRLISFVDIHGDIVTNLDADGTLSDSDNNASNNPIVKGDGRVLNNSRIEAITIRSLVAADITAQNGGPASATDVQSRFAFTSYSIFGQILAGKGLGVEGDATSGLLIDQSGIAVQKVIFGDNGVGANYYVQTKATIGGIRTGTAVNGEYFSFGYTRNDDVEGAMVPFTPPAGQVGGDVINVKSTAVYNFSSVYTGDGGLGARGGNIANITLNGDDTGGYTLAAGDGGRGTTGGAGGSIVNFTDLGSVTGEVNIKTGDGGQGTNGLGGNGGTLGFGSSVVTTSQGVIEVANLNLNAGLTINLGDGGTGFRGGGNGASLTNLVVRSPDSLLSAGQVTVGTTHDGAHDPVTGKLINVGVIGNANSFDFNGDGFNDLVYAVVAPSQLFVAFGDGLGGFSSTMSLGGPTNISAATVADVNGDGHPDVVVGSSQAGDFSGVTVFLSKYSNTSGAAVFQGFASPLISPLPSLNSGDPDSPFSYAFGYRRSSNPITSITAGDFDGDGRTDIALTADYITPGLIGVQGGFIAVIEQVLMIMSPDVEGGSSTGHFYADFGTKAGNGQTANSYLPFQSLGSSPDAKVLATALNSTAPYDVVTTVITDGTLTLGSVSGISPTAIRNSYLNVFDIHQKQFGPVQLGSINFAGVDTNRNLNQVTRVLASLRDFAIIDFNNDQNADFIGLTDTPAGFLVGWKGDGGGGGSTALTNPGAPGDNAGYTTNPLGLGAPISIKGAVPSGHGSMTGVVVLLGVDLQTFQFDPAVPVGSVVGNPGVSSRTPVFGFHVGLGNFGDVLGPRSTDSFDTFIVNAADPLTYDIAVADVGLYTYAGGNPTPGFFGLGNESSSFPIFDLTAHFVSVTSGDGGDGQIGRGGNGGTIGNGFMKDTGRRLEGGFDYTLPVFGIIDVDLHGGNGGNGFSLGGAGGGVSGVVVRFNPDSTLVGGTVLLDAGNGGDGSSGAGGAGGSISRTSVIFGGRLDPLDPDSLGGLFAGNGGDGLTGGNGGSIIGHGFKAYADNITDAAFLQAGIGGDGLRRGGSGGSVLDYHSQFNINLVGSSGGYISYTAGRGGSASAGPGGIGGDVNNVNVFVGGLFTTPDNLLAGDIFMQAGDGGDGTIGARGGIINGFVNRQTGDSPGLLVFIAGNGGDGSKGNGGAGGTVSNLSVSSGGTHHTLTPTLSPFSYNHIVAGAGGSSANAVGGAGGSVLNVTTTASDNTYAVAAGAGGGGLITGGAGGSVKMLGLAVGGKGLIIAGNGGDAGAFLGDGMSGTVTPTGPIGFGGRVGKGGAGGSIVGFNQIGGTATHFDLIAGNGGDSLNFGSRANTLGKLFVGTGGSILNVSVQGTLGNTNSSILIKSYNDLLGGETMGDFVDRVLRNPTDVVQIDDSHGNVGIVVGAAGRLNSLFAGYDETTHEAIYKSIAAFNAVSGDLSNVRSTGILAAVAGSVDQIATIRTVRNVVNFNAGPPVRVGWDKVDSNGVVDNGHPEYRSGDLDGLIVDDTTGQRVIPNVPLIDGRLVDGAIVSASAPVGSLFSGDSHVFVIAS